MIALVVQCIDRSTAKTTGQSGLDSGQRLWNKRRAAPSHTDWAHTGTLLYYYEASARTCNFECNHGDEITLQPALDHLTLTHTHTPPSLI